MRTAELVVIGDVLDVTPLGGDRGDSPESVLRVDRQLRGKLSPAPR